MSTRRAKETSLLFENQVCYPLYNAANAVVRAYRPLLDPLGLTYLQYMVMLILWERDNVSVNALGRRMNLDSGTLTPLLKRLDAKGLVERKRSSQDERVRIISLTGPGRALSRQALGIPEQLACNLGVTAEELGRLRQLCTGLLSRQDLSRHAVK